MYQYGKGYESIMNNDSRPDSSDFMARLQAMREGKKNQPTETQMPSLKDRLQAKGLAPAGNAADDVRARIQDKFKKKPSSAPNTQPTLDASTSQAALDEPKPLPSLETGQLPQTQAKQNKDDELQTWSVENGGVCPSCNAYNLAGVVFCGSCNYMLLRSEVAEVVITTSYPLKEIKGLVHTFLDKLAQVNVRTTEDVLRVATSHRNRQTLIKHTGMSDRSLLRLVHQADFCRVPSMGPENAAMLELLGITTLADFLKFKPLELYKKIQQAKIKLNQNGIVFLPTKNQVSTWFEEAQSLNTIQIQ